MAARYTALVVTGGQRGVCPANGIPGIDLPRFLGPGGTVRGPRALYSILSSERLDIEGI